MKISGIAKKFINLDKRDQSLLSQALFFIALGTWLVGFILRMRTTFAPKLSPFCSYEGLQNACFVILFVRELLFGRWDSKTFFGFFLFAIMGYMAYTSNNAVLIVTIAFVFCGRNVSFKSITQFFCVVLLALLVVTSACALVGVIPEYVEGSKHFLGFSDANVATALMSAALVCWIVLRGHKFGVIDALVCLAVIGVLFYLTHLKLPAAMCAVLVVVAFVMKWIPDGFFRNPVVKVVTVGSVVICACVALALAAFYDPSIGWMRALDSLASGRLELGHAAMQKYGFAIAPENRNFNDYVSYSLSKNTMRAIKNPGIPVSCVYVRLALSCGVVFLVIGAALATASAMRAHANGQWYLLLAIGFMAFTGLFETSCIFVQFDPLLFLMGELFYTSLNNRVSLGAKTRHGTARSRSGKRASRGKHVR